jgi:predicted site-specific integrase-resolvase
MSLVGLSEAARLTGKAHTTIHRAMKAGRLSFTVDEAGERRVDTAELARVFGLNTVNGASLDAIASDVQRNAAHVREIELLTQQLADRDATIRDLRSRLDAEAEERRRVQERLTGLLTHRQAGSVPSMPRTATVDAPREPWWQRWFRG